METIEYQLRFIKTQDWAILLFAVSVIIVAVNRTLFSNKFFDFIRLAVSDKYIRTYKNPSNISNGFTIGFLAIHLINVSFFILIILSYFDVKSKFDFIAYIQIFTLFTAYTACKFLIEKIVSNTFEIDSFTNSFLLSKINYKNFLGFILLPINLLFYFNPHINTVILYSVVSLIVLINLTSYFTIIKLNQSSIGNKIFYFILYLCTLEIAPYYFIYYLITNK